MALEAPKVIDAVGIERDTGFMILSILDAWDWTDEQGHIAALRAKLDSYILFVESGEILDTQPEAAFRRKVISWVTKCALPPAGLAELKRLQGILESAGFEFRHAVCSGSDDRR